MTRFDEDLWQDELGTDIADYKGLSRTRGPRAQGPTVLHESR